MIPTSFYKERREAGEEEEEWQKVGLSVHRLDNNCSPIFIPIDFLLISLTSSLLLEKSLSAYRLSFPLYVTT